MDEDIYCGNLENKISRRPCGTCQQQRDQFCNVDEIRDVPENTERLATLIVIVGDIPN